jgi:hypothetical protein
MKRPRFPRSRIDFRSLAVQTSLELAAGGILTLALMRWIES